MTPKMGYVIDDKGSQPMSGIRLAAQTREAIRNSPTLMLHALENPADVTAMPNQKLAASRYPAIGLKVGAVQVHGAVRPQDQAAGGDPHPATTTTSRATQPTTPC